MDGLWLCFAILISFCFGVRATHKHYLSKEKEKIEENDRSEIAYLKNEINEIKRKFVDMSNCENK